MENFIKLIIILSSSSKFQLNWIENTNLQIMIRVSELKVSPHLAYFQITVKLAIFEIFKTMVEKFVMKTQIASNRHACYY